MLSRHRRLKHMLVLVAAQVVCIAVGFLINYHFAVSAVRGEANKEALADLAVEVERLQSAASRLELADQAAEGRDPSPMRSVLEAQPLPAGVRLAVVDSQWRVVEVLRAGDDSSSPQLAGQKLDWIQTSENSGGNGELRSGSLAIGGGHHIGVACHLRDPPGYLVAYLPLEHVKVSPAALAEQLPAVSLIALIWTCSLLGIAVYMIVSRFYDELAKRRSQVEAETLRRIQSLMRARNVVIFGLAKLAESRDQTTGAHLERMTAYASHLAAAARRHPKHRDVMTAEFVQTIGISSALHDIGKVGVPDSILLKPGPLTKEERVSMQQHTLIGGKCLLGLEQRLGASNFLQMAREIALSHHEYWDGAGYPAGMAGEEIPLAARIVAIADTYDALSSARVYKAAWPHEQCVALIRDEAGKRFDPDLVEVFLTIEASFRQIARRYRGNTDGSPQLPCPAAAESDTEGCTPSPSEVVLKTE